MGEVELTHQQEIELAATKEQERAARLIRKKWYEVYLDEDRILYQTDEVEDLLKGLIEEIREGKVVAKVEVDPAEKTMQDRYEELSDRRKRLEAKGDLLNAALVDVRRAELVVICGILDIPLQQRREG